MSNSVKNFKKVISDRPTDQRSNQRTDQQSGTRLKDVITFDAKRRSTSRPITNDFDHLVE